MVSNFAFMLSQSSGIALESYNLDRWKKDFSERGSFLKRGLLLFCRTN